MSLFSSHTVSLHNQISISALSAVEPPKSGFFAYGASASNLKMHTSIGKENRYRDIELIGCLAEKEEKGVSSLSRHTISLSPTCNRLAIRGNFLIGP